jgi:hypothetical protein
MHRTDFYKLPRSVQERFLGSLNGRSPPRPILIAYAENRASLVWLGISGLALLALLVFVRVGLGSLDGFLAIHAPPMIAVYGVFLAIAIFGVIRAFAIRRAIRLSPFRPGVYVLPVSTVDASPEALVVYPLAELATVEGPDAEGRFRLAFPNKTFEFQLADKAKAAAAARTLAEARTGFASAQERPTIAALDPLQDSGFASPLVPTTPIVRDVAAWARFGWAIAIVLGGVLGLVLWHARNARSDDLMFAAALQKNEVDSFRAYLGKITAGGEHADLVQKVLLPRAELEEAKKAHTALAIEQFLAAHPDTGIRPEIDAALRAALVAELKDAKAVGTITALDEFAKKHPNHPLAADLAAAKHGVFVATLERYKQETGRDPSFAGFVERLLAYVEKSGTAGEIHFRRRIHGSMDKADAAAAKSRYFMGQISLPSRYFDDKHLHALENEFGNVIAARFAESIPEDMFDLKVGEPIADPSAPLPKEVTVPTLFVDYVPEWVGNPFTSDRPRGVFVPIGFAVEATFRLPDENRALKFSRLFYKLPRLDGFGSDDRPEEPVYQREARDAFDEFTRAYLLQFFKAMKK